MAIALQTGRPGAGKSYEAVAHTIMPGLERGRRVCTNIPLDLPTISTVLGKTVSGTSWQLPTANKAGEAAGRLAAEDGYEGVPNGDELRAADLKAVAAVNLALAANSEAELRLCLWGDVATDVMWFPSDVWRVPPRPAARSKNTDAYDLAVAVRRLWFADALEMPGVLFMLDEVWRLWPSGMRQDVVPAEERQFLAEHRHKVDEGHSQEIVLLVQSARNMSSWPLELVDHWVDLRKLNKLGISTGYKALIWDGVDKDKTLLRKEVRKYEPKYWRCYQSATGHTTTRVPRVTRDGITFEAEPWQIGMRIESATGVEGTTDSRATLFGGGRGWRLAAYAALGLAAVVLLFSWWLSGGGLMGTTLEDGDDAAEPPAARHRPATTAAAAPQPAATTTTAAADAPPAEAAAETPPPGGRDPQLRSLLADLVAGFDGHVVLQPSWLSRRVTRAVVPGRTVTRTVSNPALLAMCAGDDCGSIELDHVDHVRIADCVAQVAGRLVLCGNPRKGGADDEKDTGVDFLGEGA